MTPRERVVRLEGLLSRIARNAARPRTRRVTVTPTPVAAVPAPAPIAIPAPQPSAPDSAPVVVAVPAIEPATIGRASDVPPPSSVPTAPPAAPASALASTPPFESMAPVAEAPPVAAAPPIPAASSSISSVPPWKPEPGSTIQARPSTMPPEELSDDDLVEVTTVPPPLVPDPVVEASSDAVEVELEEPPASSRRSKLAESLDQAIASAAAEPELEVPIHTPPPESGPQEAVLPAGIEAPRAPEFAELATDIARPVSIGPTTEQLGETIELEGADGPEIEIEVAGVAVPLPEPERPVEELEVALPRAEMPSGTYDVSVSMPAEAPVVLSTMPTMPATQALEPDVTARPAVADADVMRVVRITDKAPDTFAELLDTSLGL